MSIGDAASGVPAGWYPDPADDARLRRWDGEKWTPDVILAPQDEPVGFVPPPSVPTPTETLAPPAAQQQAPPQPVPAQPAPEPAPAQQVPAPPPAPAPPTAPAPPPSAPPPPPSAAPTAPPPGTAPSSPLGGARPPAGPPPTAPTSPPSGPVSLPEWATLPGLTLPPDLSGIPGLEPEPVLKAPTFEEPHKPTLRAPDWNSQASPPDHAHPTPARNYAPPPAGAQYDVPPPPGAARVPAGGPILPASSLTVPRPPVAPAPVPPGPLAIGGPPRVSGDQSRAAPVQGGLTLWAWLIALLPLIQFGVVYVVFQTLGTQFQPGVQWGILAAPAAFSLLFAIGDQRSLVNAGVDRAPSPLLAIVPPIYLLARAIDVGRSSALLLVLWIALQGAAVAGVYFVLPNLLALAIKAVG